ncbi:HAD family hydrolase [Abditibacterium utsteinense]|uniref:HAD family hydrolase n=1 Tax=Abditibacterium utsteinense TaxID=1960156 RepID=UPI0013004D9F|nr:HAD family hydrolase [Abditibacterium utsteinense]
MTSSSIQAAIFDFDGTLADTFPAIHAAWNAAMEPIFNRTFSRDEVIERFGPPDEGMIGRELKDFPFQTLQDAIEIYYRGYEAASQQTSAFEGIEDLLEELQKRAIPVAVMTGKGRRAAEISLRHFGWENRFEVLLTGTEITNPKPAPDGPLLAAQMLKIAPQSCLYIGDSPADVGAARAAGMKPVVAGWHSYFLPQLREMKVENWANSPLDVLSFLD